MRPPDLVRPDGSGKSWKGVECGAEVCLTPKHICCRLKPFAFPGKCIGIGDGCHVASYPCDDPGDCPMGTICCRTGIIGAACMTAPNCIAVNGEFMCRENIHCPAGQNCCGNPGEPVWFCAGFC